MTALVLSLTNAGLAAVQGASGSDQVIIAELGLTATPFDVAPTLTALPGEFKRIGAVSGAGVAANITHMSAYDTSSDIWNATGVGLWSADGTLIAVYSSNSTIVNKAAPAFALIAFDIAWQADLAASIAFGDPAFTNPPATEEMRGLIELATQGEANAGTDNLRALTPAKAKAALLSWLLAQDGAGSGVDADTLDGQHLSRVSPAGIVALWPVSRGAIPTGWHIMDGTNGTDDWRDKFVMSAGPTYAAGATGGAALHNHGITVNGHALTEAQIPSHNHGLDDPGHAHQQRRDDAFGAQNTSGGNPDGTHGAVEYGLTSEATTGITISAAGGGEAHSHGASSENASSLPPYVVAYYIQKL